MTRAAALLLLLAPSAAASTEGWPLTSEESVRLEAEHAQAAADMAALLEKVEAHRLGYKTAFDPDAALSRWTDDANAMQPFIQKMHTLGRRHSAALKETDLYLIVATLGKKPHKDGSPHEVTVEYQEINARNQVMAARSGNFQHRWDDAHARLEEERKARAVRIKHEAENRLLLRIVGAGGAVLFVLVLWAARRYRSAPAAALAKR